MADQWQVEVFLHSFKDHWPPNCFVVPREKNNQALADLCLTPFQRRNVVLDLSISEYSDGPRPDIDFPDQDVWVFGATNESMEIYIKLTLKKVPEGFLAKCLSFHKSERRLNYPFRQR